MSEPTRREWLWQIGAGGAALALGCGGDARSRDLATAVLDPAPDALLVAVWARAAREAVIHVRTAAGAQVAALPLALGDSGSAALDVGGLAPGTAYEIVVSAGGDRSGTHRARTAPAPDDPRPVRLAIAADVDPRFDPGTDIVAHLAAAEPELLVTLGDFPYADDPPAARDLAAYRERHAEVRTAPLSRALLEIAGVRAIYDDHEFVNDWDARAAAEDPERLAAALAAWDEFFPRRDPSGDVRYRSWRWGAHAECFLLDCRRFRSVNSARDDLAKTMLGPAQHAWLAAGLAASTATFKLVLTSVPLDFANGVDSWRGYVTARTALFDAVRGIPGVLFLSADQHWFAAHRHARGIRELQFGPLVRGLIPPPPAAPGVITRIERPNAGLLDIDGERITATALGPGGERLYEETLTPADLTPA